MQQNIIEQVKYEMETSKYKDSNTCNNNIVEMLNGTGYIEPYNNYNYYNTEEYIDFDDYNSIAELYNESIYSHDYGTNTTYDGYYNNTVYGGNNYNQESINFYKAYGYNNTIVTNNGTTYVFNKPNPYCKNNYLHESGNKNTYNNNCNNTYYYNDYYNQQQEEMKRLQHSQNILNKIRNSVLEVYPDDNINNNYSNINTEEQNRINNINKVNRHKQEYYNMLQYKNAENINSLQNAKKLVADDYRKRVEEANKYSSTEEMYNIIANHHIEIMNNKLKEQRRQINRLYDSNEYRQLIHNHQYNNPYQYHNISYYNNNDFRNSILCNDSVSIDDRTINISFPSRLENENTYIREQFMNEVMKRG